MKQNYPKKLMLDLDGISLTDQEVTLLTNPFVAGIVLFSRNFRKNINLISKFGGIILLITGFLILTNQLQAIGFYIIEIFPFMQKFG